MAAGSQRHSSRNSQVVNPQLPSSLQAEIAAVRRESALLIDGASLSDLAFADLPNSGPLSTITDICAGDPLPASWLANPLQACIEGHALHITKSRKNDAPKPSWVVVELVGLILGGERRTDAQTGRPVCFVGCPYCRRLNAAVVNPKRFACNICGRSATLADFCREQFGELLSWVRDDEGPAFSGRRTAHTLTSSTKAQRKQKSLPPTASGCSTRRMERPMPPSLLAITPKRILCVHLRSNGG